VDIHPPSATPKIPNFHAIPVCYNLQKRQKGSQVKKSGHPPFPNSKDSGLRPLVQILVVVANIQARTLKVEVEKGFMRTAIDWE
jgi:hypothetical protein